MYYKLYHVLAMIIKNKIHVNEGQTLNEIKKNRKVLRHISQNPQAYFWFGSCYIIIIRQKQLLM